MGNLSCKSYLITNLSKQIKQLIIKPLCVSFRLNDSGTEQDRNFHLHWYGRSEVSFGYTLIEVFINKFFQYVTRRAIIKQGFDH